MNITNSLMGFSASESGAVTVDWVVLTASIVVIAVAVVTIIMSGVNQGAENIEETILRYDEPKMNIASSGSP
ncbi:MAG: pilus assembly protein [Paracoccaceae bacterium]